jgi:hypothetical protein
LLGPSPDRGDNDVEADTVGQFDDSDEGWEPVDPNEWNGYDLDCADVGGPVEIYGIDPNGLDRDGDGIGCE